MRKQFIIWNNLLRCDSTTITGAPATVVNHDRTDDDTESKSPALAEMEIQVVEQLKLQPDGSYIVSVYDTVMAIIKLAARDRFAVITMTELQWISKVRSIEIRISLVSAAMKIIEAYVMCTCRWWCTCLFPFRFWR